MSLLSSKYEQIELKYQGIEPYFASRRIMNFQKDEITRAFKLWDEKKFDEAMDIFSGQLVYFRTFQQKMHRNLASFWNFLVNELTDVIELVSIEKDALIAKKDGKMDLFKDINKRLTEKYEDVIDRDKYFRYTKQPSWLIDLVKEKFVAL